MIRSMGKALLLLCLMGALMGTALACNDLEQEQKQEQEQQQRQEQNQETDVDVNVENENNIDINNENEIGIGIDIDTGDKIYYNTVKNYYFFIIDGKKCPVPPGTEVGVNINGEKHHFWTPSITGDRMETGFKTRRYCYTDRPSICGSAFPTKAPGGWSSEPQSTAAGTAV